MIITVDRIGAVNQFEFNGKKSFSDMNLIITETPVITCPERDIEFVSVPGRSGDIINDNGRYKNITISYKVALLAEYDRLSAYLDRIKAWLYGSTGYFKLSDTYDPLYYRMASVSGAIEVTNRLNAIGTATIQFNCKPFKYRIQNAVTITAARNLINPEAWESVPYIKIIGSGDITLSINENSYEFSDVDEYIEVDGEIMAAYKGTQLQNDKIHFTDFPTLAPGKNSISFVGNVTEIQISPRWRTL